ncbi:MAG TPA: hypothetical protein VF485_19520 [Sphingomonas sp.]
MRCFYVLVHGRLVWLARPDPSDGLAAENPHGFYCHRYVLGADESAAKTKAFERVRTNFDRQLGWLSRGWVTLALEADEIARAPLSKIVRPDNPGHTFYYAD